MGITRASFILFLGNLVGMGGYYLFQVYISRTLTPAEFGIVNALQALFFVVSVPAVIFAQSVSKHFGQRFASDNKEFIREHYLSFLRTLIYICLLGACIYYSLTGLIARFLHISTYYPLFITGLWVLLFFFFQLNQGFLIGAQRLTPVSLGIGIQGAFRWIIGVLLVVVGFGLNGALTASPLAVLLAFVITLIAVYSQFPPKTPSKKSNEVPKVNAYKFMHESYPIFFALFAFIVLTNIDMLLVKHYLSPDEAGMYSSLVVLGRGVLFLTEAIAIGVFAIGVHEASVKVSSLNTYRKGIILCFLVYVITLLIFYFIPEVIIKIVFGDKYLINAPLVKLIVISMAFFGMLKITINYNLSRNRHNFIFLLYIAIVMEAALISIFHKNISQILLVMIAVSGCLYLGNEYAIITEEKEVKPSLKDSLS